MTVTFDEDMDPGTITGTSFTLETTIGSVLVPATVGYNVGSRTATLTPTTALAVDTNYTARVTTAATDLAGNPLATNTTWAYQTSAGTSTTLFLHNAPTPPAGDTTAQPNMGMTLLLRIRRRRLSTSTRRTTTRGPRVGTSRSRTP